MADDADLPRNELLIKIMGMTTSDNDNQALVALRKANTLLREAGWDWERVLRGKIKVVENPFSGKNPFEGLDRTPPPDFGNRFTRPQPQPIRTPNPAGAQTRASTPPPPPRASLINSTRKNIYSGHCYCCGDYVANDAGFIFKPMDFNLQAKVPGKSGWAIACTSCNSQTNINVSRTPAPKNTGQTTTSVPLGSL